MTTYIIAYIGTLIAFFALDMAWLAGVARKFYANQLGRMMKIRWGWAIIFYLIYIGGIVFFAVKPGLEEQSLMTAAIMGGLFGFFCYATYDLTNLATLRDWPEKMAFVDIPWGVFLTASCAVFGTWVTLTFT
ncbi:DUF2177 family protein [Fretibacter rubidus]|uniref:DUF2177 family protein n=1 Tax=Fretibacter rubidus TaxID=570162 RepID=UPI00352B5D76